MKILLTGATGFIGNHVLRELVKSGHDIIATGRKSQLADTAPAIDRVTYIPCDLNENRNDFFDFFRKPDLCIHLSWEGLPNYNEMFHIERNLFSNYHFIKNLTDSGLKNVAVIGTCFEYGLQNGCLSEHSEARPVTAYAIAKDTLRKFIELLNMKNKFNFRWIRLFYLHGEGQFKNSILAQLKSALERGDRVFNMSGGEQLRDYLPVGKVAEYIVKIALQERILGIINCCSGTPVSIRSLVENYLRGAGKSIDLNLGYYQYPDYEPMAFWGDPALLRSVLSLYD